MTAKKAKSTEIAESNETILMDMPDDLQDELSKEDDGSNADIIPRLRIKKVLQMVMGQDVHRYPNGLDFIILGVNPVTYRELNDSVYDPNNPLPPSCFSLDGVKPHETANPPMIMDRVSGDTRCAKNCDECPAERNGNRCSWKRQFVGVLPDVLTEQGMFVFPMPAATIFHKGDKLPDIDDAENEVGFNLHLTKMKSIATKSGKPPKTFQLMTTAKVYGMEPRGEAAAFNFRDANKHIQQLPVGDIRQCIALRKTETFEKYMSSFDQYLLNAGRYWQKKNADGADAVTTDDADAPTPDSVDDLDKEMNG